MARRSTVQRACQSCRKSRTKCDGRQACGRCKAKSLHCSYERPEALSKAMLRDEVKKLRQQLDETDLLFNALKSNPGTGTGGVADLIIEGLRRGDSRESIIKTLNCMQRDDTQCCQAAQSTMDVAFHLKSATAGSDTTCPNLASHQWPAHASESDASSSTTSVGTSTTYESPVSAAFQPFPVSHTVVPLSLAVGEFTYPFALPEQLLEPQQDFWTNSGWTRSDAREFITSVLLWDAIPLCVVDRVHFLADFDSGASHYCSSALVHALLALATCMKENKQSQQENQTFMRQYDTCTSATFLRKASTCTSDYEPLSVLPNIQALGVLAVYQANFGLESEAQKLVEKFVKSMAALCLDGPSLALDGNYDRICVDTYRAAASLQRLYHFTGLSIGDGFATPEDNIISYDIGEATPSAHGDLDSQHLIAHIFRLTGWLSELKNQRSRGLTFSAVVALYFKCLGWYKDTFAYHSKSNFSNCTSDGGDDKSDDKIMSSIGGDREAIFVIFIHMFYHYSILEIFALAAVDRSQVIGSLQIQDIGCNAAQSILSLATSATAIGSHREESIPSSRLTSRFIFAAESFLTTLYPISQIT